MYFWNIHDLPRYLADIEATDTLDEGHLSKGSEAHRSLASRFVLSRFCRLQNYRGLESHVKGRKQDRIDVVNQRMYIFDLFLIWIAEQRRNPQIDTTYTQFCF